MVRDRAYTSIPLLHNIWDTFINIIFFPMKSDVNLVSSMFSESRSDICSVKFSPNIKYNKSLSNLRNQSLIIKLFNK